MTAKFRVGDVVINEDNVHGIIMSTSALKKFPIEVAFMDGNTYTYTTDGYCYENIKNDFFIRHLKYDDGGIIRQTTDLPDVVVVSGGVEFGIMVDEYEEIPPSGKCRQRCETPEDYYGDTIIEYRIVSIWTDDDHDPHYDLLGENLAVPPEINSSDIDNEVLNFLRGDEYEG